MANTLTFANQTLTDADIFGGISFLADLNTGEEFSIGNTASSSVSFVTETQLPLYSQDSTNGTFTWTRDNVSRGRYYITEVTKAAGKYTVTAYDAMILLDAKITSLSLSYPITVSAIASAIATYIGCTVSGTVNNGTISVSDLDDDMSIRQLLGYVAEASGCSVKIDGSNHLCFMYYADSGITITASQYKEFGLEVADYTCAAIDSVQIFDIAGMVHASAGTGTNTLFIQGNPLLYDATNAIAAVILDQVDGFAYAPLKCDMFEENGLEIGTIATFGTTPSLVMHLESSESGALASSVGNATRELLNKSIDVIVNEAKETVKAMNQHFWYVSSGAEAGAHIAEIPKAQFDVTPSGGNLIARSNGIAVRDGLTELTTIGTNGMDIIQGGKSVANFGSIVRIGPTTNNTGDSEYPSSYLSIAPFSNADESKGTRLKFISTTGAVGMGAIDTSRWLTADEDYRELHLYGPYGEPGAPEIVFSYNSSAERGINIWLRDAQQIQMSNSNGSILVGNWYCDSTLTSEYLKSDTHVHTTAGAIGEYKSASNSAAVSLANSTAKALTSISLTAGTWVVSCHGRFANNATGYRRLNLSTTSGDSAQNVSSPAVNGNTTDMYFTRIMRPTATTTFYLNGWQNSGSAMSMPASQQTIYAVRIA